MQLQQLNHITIVERIGSGGTARVYKGVDTNTGFAVAVKILWGNFFQSDAMKQRFLEEANHYLYLDHPNIIRLRDFIQLEDMSYLVMEYVEGVNLEDYITDFSGPVPGGQALAIFRDILSGVRYAHENDVLHLDIKPANIMIEKSGGVKIIDFGISTGFREANKGSIMGSPLYMSPEQTDGAGIDERTDIYSLGITLFYVLTGSPPFKENLTREELFAQIKQGNLPRANSIYPFVSDDWQNIIDKATHIDKRKRFQNAGEFQEALNKIAPCNS